MRSVANAPWIRSLPSSWSAQRAKTVLYRAKELNSGHGEKQVLSLTLRGVVENDPENPEGLVPEDYATYQLFESGDLVFKLIDLENVRTSRVGLVPMRGIMSSAYMRLRPRPGVCVQFLYWTFFDLYNRQIFNHLGNGVRSTLGVEDVLNLPLPLPDTATQQAIANYLDTETARIDSLIAKKQRMLELLDARFRSLIDAEISSSARVPLKRLVSFQEGPGIMADDFKDEGVPLVRVSGVGGHQVTLDGCNYLDPVKVRNRWSHFALDEGDYLISASASMGIASLVGPEAAGAIPYTGLIRFKPATSSVDMNFIRYFLISADFMRQIDQLKTGAAMQHFGPSHLGQVTLPKLGLDEQRRISELVGRTDYLRQRTSAAIDRHINLLRERRQALITAAVTGDLEIPGMAA